MLELALTRLFSATMYYHFAFLAISLALFGSGASGVFLYLVREGLDRKRTARRMTASALQFSVTTVLALGVILSNPLSLEPGPGNYLRLAVIYGASALPFFFAGCAVTLAVMTFAGEIGRLYLFDLAGAALGCLLLIPILDSAGATNTLLVVAALAALAGVVFSRSEPGGPGRGALATALAAACALVAVYSHATGLLEIRKAKGVAQENVLFSKWNSFSRITVRGSLAGPFLHLQIDSDASTRIVRDAGDTRLHENLRRSIKALAYELKPRARALIIGPGGGSDVMIARAFGAGEIVAVEVNPIIARDVMSSEPFRSYSGNLYEQPGVRLVVDEGRSFIRGSRARYDIIQATLVDTWAATAAGAFALTENNLYTVEAFKDYISHLAGDGILTMTRWYFDPPDQLLRILSLTRVALQELAITDAPAHVMLVTEPRGKKEDAPATFLLKKSPFTADEVRRIESAAAGSGFALLYTPLTRPRNDFSRLLEAADPSELWRSFETDIAPTRDNNPFFFNSVRVSNLSRALRGAGEWHKTNLGVFVLFALFGISAVVVVFFIAGPLAATRGRIARTAARERLRYLAYFGCLGTGFIIVEVVLVQKFILFLGHPVYALTVVLFSILIWSAAGSYLSGRLAPQNLKRAAAFLIAALVALVVAYIFALPPLFYGLVHLALPARIAIAVAVIAPLALLLGAPMPCGIRILARGAPELIPWAWGVNGAASVLGSVAALVIALLAGFNQALAVAALLYACAIPLIGRFEA